MATTDTSPGTMTTGPSTEQHVTEEMKKWVEELNADAETKFYEDAVNHIESIVRRQICCLETTWVERQYVKIVLEMWLRASFVKAFADLDEKSSDFNSQISELLQQLKLINSFEDIRLELPAESKLRDWCECRYLQLILGQTSLFKNTPRFAILVPSYFQHFKTSLTDQILSRCRNDLTQDQIDLISTLNEFLANAINRDHTRSQDSLEENFLENEIGKGSIEKIVNSFQINNQDPTTDVLRDRFKLMNASLSDDSWTPQLKLLIKETCENLLLPKTVVEVQNEDGKKIIFIKGVAVFVSKILQEMIDRKSQNSNVKEIKIVGLLSVHVDCDLELKDWHGMNVGIVTDKIYVDKEVCWDVSGQDGNDQPEGKPGQPGESGGNIHVICKEMINAEKWTIISDGGDGGDGQNGAVRKIGPDGKETFHRKWSKEEFQKNFPTMSTFDDSTNEKAMEKVLTTLKEILPVNTRIKGKDVLPGYRKDFYIGGTTKEDSEITITYFKGKKTRHTLIYSKGNNNIGQGGYGGFITIEYSMSEPNKIPLSVPLVGKDAQQPSAVRMDVYQASGSVGRTGKPAGDVGFIHRVKKKDKNNGGEGHYFGFDNDVILTYKKNITKKYFKEDNIPYAKFMDPYKTPNTASYASILSAGTEHFLPELKHSAAIEEAVKMNAIIIRQDLVQHLTEIDERKQMAQSLQATATSHSMGQQSERIEKLIKQIDEKQAKLQRLSCQRSQQREEFRQCYVKPSAKTIKVQNSLSSFTTPVGQRGCRPVDLQLNQPKITCLDLLPTVEGNDSALHSILGRMNSAGLYVCADTDKIRQQIANLFLKDKKEENKMIAVKNFVLRQNDEAFPFASARKKEFLICRQQNGDESQFNWLQPPELSEEYVRFIQSPLGELDLPEVEFLAEVLNITIHVYEDQHDSSSFKHKITFNPDSLIEQKHFILYKGGGEWHRLEANENLQQFCNQLPMDLLQSVQQQTNYFSTLIDLLTERNRHELIASIKILNPEDGVTPDKLSQLLLEKHFNQLLTAPPEDEQQNDEVIGKQFDELASDIRLLTERVLEYNERNVSPIFYLYIVSKCTEPYEWKYEFLLLEMEERLTELPENRDVWKEEILASLKNLDDQTVAVLRSSLIMATDFYDFPFSTMERILKILPVKSGSDEIDSVDQLPVELLSQLPLKDWLYELRSKIWERKVNQLNPGDLHHGELAKLMKEAIYLLLELEYQKGETFCKSTTEGINELPKLVDKLRETLYPCTNATESVKERDCETIVSIIEKEGKGKCNTEEQKESQTKLLRCIKNNAKHLKSKQPEIGEKLKKLTEELHTKLRSLKISNNFFSSSITKTIPTENELLSEYLHVYDSFVRLEMGFPLRDTQRVAIMFLIIHFLNEKKILAQVSTGEGKSLIVAGVAIFCAISGMKVDVVTSNDVLALRDSTLSVADGGLRDIYEKFGVGVANNCSQSQDDRAKAYNSAVVYGELANFQRDYLLHTFYGLNVRGDRQRGLATPQNPRTP